METLLREKLAGIGLEGQIEGATFEVDDSTPIFSVPTLGNPEKSVSSQFRTRKAVLLYERFVLKTGEPSSPANHDAPEEQQIRNRNAQREYKTANWNAMSGLPVVAPVCLFRAPDSDLYLVEPRGLPLGSYLECCFQDSERNEKALGAARALGAFFGTVTARGMSYDYKAERYGNVFGHMLLFEESGSPVVRVTDAPEFHSPAKRDSGQLKALRFIWSRAGEFRKELFDAYREGYRECCPPSP